MIKNEKIKIDDVSVVILAGGLGKRIRHLYPDKPKSLIKFKNQPFLYWIVKEINKLHLRSIIYATGYKSKQIECWVNNNEFKNLDQKIIQEEKKMGTAGSIFNVINFCKNYFIVLNSDTFLENGLEKLILSIDKKISGALVCHYTQDMSRFGSIKFDKNNNLINFHEKKKDGSGYINSGIYFFNKKKVTKYKINEFMSLEYELFPNMIKNNEKIKVVKIKKPKFIDIGTEESILESKQLIQRIFNT